MIVNPEMVSPINSDELKIVVIGGDICSISGDTLFVHGIYQPAFNEYPEYAPTSWYGCAYAGAFVFEIHYSDSILNHYELGSDKCLTDKQCEAINLQITCESDFATGKHCVSYCAAMGENNNLEDSLAAFWVRQLPELATPYHDHGEGTVTISWTGFDGTPRQHVLYFIMDDHFYIDYVGYGVEENEDVSANGVRVYPNPTDGTFTIEAENIANVEIFDLAGQKVLTDRSGSRTINAGSLPTGVYFLKAETATETKYGKLIKK